MPSVNCPVCKKMAPVKWDRVEQRWRFWPHGPENKRCPGSDRLLSSKVVP